ncbi:MAG: transposase [Acidobacteria bacterium]|nr:transposase [Acidobacteriota bacterium]
MTTSTSRLGPDFQTWLRDDPTTRDAILDGKDVDVTLTNYGQNDFLLEFLMGSGLWNLLVSVRPAKLRKENGKPWKAMNGLEVLRELSRIDRITHCGRVIADTRLMMIAGFNAEEIRRARRRDGLVVSPETLANHLARMRPREVVDAFYEHVSVLRKKKWIGRGVYAADAHEITFPHARGWDGMGKVGEAHGFKLVVVIRAIPGPERIVGFALGPLHVSEHRLLEAVLRQLESRVCPVKKLIDVLVLDRGYWGAEFLLGLRKKYGFHFVTPTQHDGLGVVQDIEGLLKAQAHGTSNPPQEFAEDRSRLGKIKVRLQSLEKVPLCADKDRVVGTANVVVVDELDRRGKPLTNSDGSARPRIYYVTSLPTKGKPYEIREYYLKRWVVENEGFRNLTQRWARRRGRPILCGDPGPDLLPLGVGQRRVDRGRTLPGALESGTQADGKAGSTRANWRGTGRSGVHRPGKTGPTGGRGVRALGRSTRAKDSPGGTPASKRSRRGDRRRPASARPGQVQLTASALGRRPSRAARTNFRFLWFRLGRVAPARVRAVL